VAGHTTLTELFALYSLSEVMVTNDSGPAHYATLTDIDVVTLFGPESPDIFGARSDRSHLLWAGLACSPCVNAFNQRVTACTNNLCMQGIGVDEVFEKVTAVLDQSSSDVIPLRIPTTLSNHWRTSSVERSSTSRSRSRGLYNPENLKNE